MHIYFYIGLPWWLSNEESTCQCRRCWFSLWVRKIPWRGGKWQPTLASVQFSHSVSNSLQPHESQRARPPCPSQTPGVYSNSCSSSQWCHPAISSSVVPFSSCPQFLPASGSFPMSQLFSSGGQSIGVSAAASILLINTQDLSPLGWTGWISSQSKEFSRVFSNTTLQYTCLENHLWQRSPVSYSFWDYKRMRYDLAIKWGQNHISI